MAKGQRFEDTAQGLHYKRDIYGAISVSEALAYNSKIQLAQMGMHDWIITITLMILLLLFKATMFSYFVIKIFQLIAVISACAADKQRVKPLKKKKLKTLQVQYNSLFPVVKANASAESHLSHF